MLKKKIGKTGKKSALAGSRSSVNIAPEEVAGILRKHLLIDGFDIVFDLKQSKGSYVFDSRTKKRYLDFFTFFGSSPIGFNHPKMTTKDFMEKLAYVSVQKPSCSDSYTMEMAEFMDIFARTAIPDYLPHAFLIEGGALAVENALKSAFDFRVQKNLKSGFYTSENDANRLQVVPLQKGFPWTVGLHAFVDKHRSRQDQVFPEIRVASCS